MENFQAENILVQEILSPAEMALTTTNSTVQLVNQADTKQRMNLAVECKDLMMLYVCAIKEMQTRLEVLNTEYTVRCRRNPIHSIHSRLKSSASIVEKLNRKGVPFSPENIEAYIQDVAGIRVICSYVDDIFMIAEAVSHQDGVELVARKDYITHPKPNGYRSLHLILSVPVSFSRSVKNVKVEVQIRTIAMDCWASLEHQLKYKHSIKNEQEIVEELRQCALDMAHTDATMQSLRARMDNDSPPSEDELLLEKLKRMDHPMD